MLLKVVNCLRLCSKCILTDVQKRKLYSPSILGLDKFKYHQQRNNTMRTEHKDVFISKMEKELSDIKHPYPVLEDDIKCLVYLCGDSDRDLTLLSSMLQKFISDNKQVEFSKYHFGPYVMRMLHLLNKPELAFQMLMDEKYGQFFHQNSSFLPGMDLLFEQGHYDKVLKLCDKLEDIQIDGFKHHKGPTVLAAAACLKMNTSGSYRYCLELKDKLEESPHPNPDLFLTYLSHLAFKQGDLSNCLETIELLKFKKIIYFNVKILALTQKLPIQDVVEMLQKKVAENYPTHINFLSEILAIIANICKSKGSKEKYNEYIKFCQSLYANGYILDSTLEDLIFKEINIRKPDCYQLAHDERESPDRPDLIISDMV